MTDLPHRPSQMPVWFRAVLVLLFVAIGSSVHTSAAAISAPGTVVGGTSIPSAGHCISAVCEKLPHYSSECCGGGSCLCTFEPPSALPSVDAGQVEHIGFEPSWRKQLTEGIDRPTKAKAVDLLPSQQDTV